MKIGEQNIVFKRGERPGRLIKEAARDMSREIDLALKPFGASIANIPVIHALSVAGQLPQSELARLCNVEQPTMAQMLKRMERDGILSRQQDPNDKRSYLFSLTEDYANHMGEIEREVEEVNERAFAGVSMEEFEIFRKVLKMVSVNMNANMNADVTEAEKFEANGKID